jgi:CRP-like cAMP-binding protein
VSVRYEVDASYHPTGGGLTGSRNPLKSRSPTNFGDHWALVGFLITEGRVMRVQSLMPDRVRNGVRSPDRVKMWFWRNALKLHEPLRVTRRSRLFRRDGDQSVVLIVSGLAKLSCELPDGREITVCLRGPGSVISNVVGEGQHPLCLSCIALTECSIHRLDRQSFLATFERDGRFAGAVLQSWEDFLRDVLNALLETRTLTVRQRLENLLYELSVYGVYPQAVTGHASFTLRDCDIAEILNVSRSFLSRIKASRCDSQPRRLRHPN